MADAPISEELTALKKRARRRLVGAIALVLVALIVLWTVMDDKPPQSLLHESVAIVSSTPSLAGSVKPEPVPVPAPESHIADSPSGVVLPPPKQEPAKSVVENMPPAVAPTPKPVPSKVQTPPAKPVEKRAESKPEPSKKDPARLLAGLDDEMLAKPATTRPSAKEDAGAAAKFFLQIGAFADASKATALQTKAKEAGVTAHTEAVKTDKGELTRLRAGPYTSRDLAERAHDKLAAAGVASSIVGK
ncbi:SPOR domain-containing protein [Chitinimonas sp. PSY-7]|uniref:SPOR domain-containing protein n=1 Tax=Chitinimonas sp. PSY-7 TaxID=3459088 RepID=UPI00404020E6